MKQTLRNSTLLQEIAVTIGCIVFLAALALTPVTSVFQRALLPLTTPLQLAMVNASQSGAVLSNPVAEWFGAQQKLMELSQRLAQSEGQLAQLVQLQEENAQLRLLLENRHVSVRPRRLARPIVSSVSPLVWIGLESGVKPGWLVSYKDTLLGRVRTVDGQYASVELLNTDGELAVLVQTPLGVRGVASGKNGRVVVTNIPPEAMVSVGDRITTVGQPGIAPGKFVGIVANVERDPASAAQQLSIDQLVSFYQTNMVEIEE